MRQPIFVRPFTEEEQQRIEAGLRSSDAFVLRRCLVLTQKCGEGKLEKVDLNQEGKDHAKGATNLYERI